MSATNRGERGGGTTDFFPTPLWCISRLLGKYTPTFGLMVEPAVGNGAIVEAICRYDKKYKQLGWICYEILPWAEPTQWIRENVEALFWQCCDYLSLDDSHRNAKVKTVITNPPYSILTEYILKSRHLYPMADLVMLTRVGYLSSEKRLGLWEKVGVPDVYLLPNRPSFSGDGKTDASDYSWLCFPRQSRIEGKFVILNSTPVSERKIRCVDLQ